MVLDWVEARGVARDWWTGRAKVFVPYGGKVRYAGHDM